MKMTGTQKLVWSGAFTALGIVLPFLTGQIEGIGKMLLPMHLPVLICGFVCGAPYGMAVGFLMPLLRSTLFGMPVLFPTAVSMAFELCVYGGATGILYRRLPKKNSMIYIALLGAMLAGRLTAGLVNMILYGVRGESYSVQLFIAGMFMNAIPGIILQLVLVPAVVLLLRRTRWME